MKHASGPKRNKSELTSMQEEPLSLSNGRTDEKGAADEAPLRQGAPVDLGTQLPKSIAPPLASDLILSSRHYSSCQ